MVTRERIAEVVRIINEELYEAAFRGKPRGKFCLTREQLKRLLITENLHDSTVVKLQDRALKDGIVIVDLDDLFPCIETRVLRGLRRPPSSLVETLIPCSDQDAEAPQLEYEDEEMP